MYWYREPLSGLVELTPGMLYTDVLEVHGSLGSLAGDHIHVCS